MARLSAGDSVVAQVTHTSKTMEVVHNLLVALTVSSIALSLGAAFGVLSGRGAFAGMFSAGIIAFIAACLGGTRVQCSGPVAPMAAVMAVLFASATQEYNLNPDIWGGVTPDQYLNLICFICGGVLLLMAALRTGFLISYVPSAVISGFMTGISLIIWNGQLQTLFGWGGKEALSGDLGLNVALVIGTIALVVMTPHILRLLVSPRLARLVPGPLVAIVFMTVLSQLVHLDVQLVDIKASVPTLTGLWEMVQTQIPNTMSWPLMAKALPSGIEFALICYLDTLMVSLIVDRMTGEQSRKDKELMAQGFSNAAVGLIGGIPGTQASIRSVMMIKEGATMRLAGIMVGVFVILEMMLLLDFISMIPKAVFIGILLKVGWDVCDREPLWQYVKHNVLRRNKKPQPDKELSVRNLMLRAKNLIKNLRDEPNDAPPAHVFWIIVGTAVVTVYNLTLAVCLFTAVYYVYKAINNRRTRAKEPTHYVEERIKEVLDDAE